ncbi:hypothetical protein BY996DRAFT_6408754 [Phakopsora pachyrhizi]|nr:hypothetical protein BY996DRAFT_6408754 [Phakopsora pachyrhizi]
MSNKTFLISPPGLTTNGMGTGCRRSAQPEHLARGPIPTAPIPEHQTEEDQLQQRVGRLRNQRMESRFCNVLGDVEHRYSGGQASQHRSSITDKKFAGSVRVTKDPKNLKTVIYSTGLGSNLIVFGLNTQS